MKRLKYMAALLLVGVPALFATSSANALTARQYQHQGHGHYVYSDGNRPSRAIYHHHRTGRLRHHHRS